LPTAKRPDAIDRGGREEEEEEEKRISLKVPEASTEA